MWCCWMLSARTDQSLNVSSSMREIYIFWGFVLTSIILILIDKATGALFVIFAALLYLNYKSVMRGRIRYKLSIAGSYGSDFLNYLFCPCCTTCQEAREAKYVQAPLLDYCSGEIIQVLDESVELAIGTGDTESQTESGETNTSFIDNLHSISLTSKIILMLCGFVASMSFLLLYAADKEDNILVLLLTFVQPTIILYFIYWKSRRQYATLDMVIKLFAVGFWFTTFQSVVLESIIQALIVLVFGPFVITALEVESGGGDDSPPPDQRYMTSQADMLIRLQQIVRKGLYLTGDAFVATHSVTQQLSRPVTSHQSYAPLATNMLGGSSLLNELEEFGGNKEEEEEDADDQEEQSSLRTRLKAHLFIVIFVLFLVAFLSAACVEETMKHFIVRCCRFSTPLRDPHCILVYLVAGALGFATSENIEYVFGTVTSPIPGTSSFVGELIVLLTRVLLPGVVLLMY